MLQIIVSAASWKTDPAIGRPSHINRIGHTVRHHLCGDNLRTQSGKFYDYKADCRTEATPNNYARQLLFLVSSMELTIKIGVIEILLHLISSLYSTTPYHGNKSASVQLLPS